MGWVLKQPVGGLEQFQGKHLLMVGFLRDGVWNGRSGAEESFSAITIQEKLKEQKGYLVWKDGLESQCVRIKLKGVLAQGTMADSMAGEGD